MNKCIEIEMIKMQPIREHIEDKKKKVEAGIQTAIRTEEMGIMARPSNADQWVQVAIEDVVARRSMIQVDEYKDENAKLARKIR